MRNDSYLSILSFFILQQRAIYYLDVKAREYYEKSNWTPKLWIRNKDCKSLQVFGFFPSRIWFVPSVFKKRNEHWSKCSGGSKGAIIRRFFSKMYIALKEANETQYWLRLFHRIGYLNDTEYSSIKSDIDSIISLLMAITKSTKDDK